MTTPLLDLRMRQPWRREVSARLVGMVSGIYWDHLLPMTTHRNSLR